MKTVVIIGAGPAGLTAAYELLKKTDKYQVIILEKENQVGGISKTITYHGNKIDIGGHRFFTKEKQIEQLWKEIFTIEENIDTLPKKNKVFLKRNRVSRIFYHNKFFDYPVTINLKTIMNLGIVKTITCGFSYLKVCIHKRKEQNLEDFYINRFGKKLYNIFFKGYTKKVWGRSPKNISKDWGVQRVKGISIMACIKDYFCRLLKIKNQTKETSLIETFLYPKYGPGQFYEEMALKIEQMGAIIVKNSQVIKLNQTKNKITDLTYQVKNQEKNIKTDIVISSMPLKDLIQNLNDVPQKIENIAFNLPYRAFVTVGILVSQLSLKNKTNIKNFNNNIKDCWLYIQDDRVKLGRIQIFNNWSPYLVKNKNTVWLGLEYFCNEFDDFWNMEKQDIIKQAEQELRKIKVIDSPILDSCCFKIEKAYPAYFDSYKDIDKLKQYLNKITNLYCIGRNGQHRYNNMDHSMMTAIKCVENILNPKLSKERIWNVNIDNTYHEEKNNENNK